MNHKIYSAHILQLISVWNVEMIYYILSLCQGTAPASELKYQISLSLSFFGLDMCICGLWQCCLLQGRVLSPGFLTILISHSTQISIATFITYIVVKNNDTRTITSTASESRLIRLTKSVHKDAEGVFNNTVGTG